MVDKLEKYSLDELSNIDFRSKKGKDIKINTGLSVLEIKKYIIKKKRSFAKNRFNTNLILKRFKQSNNGQKFIGFIKLIITKWLIKNKGIPYFNRSLCTNHEDFCSLDDINDIENKYFYSIKENNKYYGFDIRSLCQLYYSKKDNVLINPFTMLPFSENVITYIKKNGHKYKEIKVDDQIRHEVFRLFQHIDSFGYCTNIEWFFDMNENIMKNWYKAGEDLWNFRAQLSQQQKNVIAPNGAFLTPIHNVFRTKGIDKLRTIILKEIDSLICHSEDRNTQALGCIYVLTIFTELSQEISNALPGISQR